jgi:sugar O-acyltransferase (sialic acid O-acetyltransferase NeuD family)
MTPSAPALGNPQPLIVVGGGGFAREVIWLAREARQPFDVIGVLDDADASQGRTLSDVPVLGRVADWTRHPQAQFVVAIGAPRTRRAVVQKMVALGRPSFATLVHRSVQHSAFIVFGAGSMVTAGCVLTTQIQIHEHVIVNIGSTVGHDTVIENFVTIAPIVAISGNVHLQAGAEVGTGSSLKQGIRIGRGATVGMGSVVTKDVDDADLVMGAPARSARRLEPF